MNEHAKGVPLGALAYYGGSVDITWDPPAIMAVAIGKFLREKSNSKKLFSLLLQGQFSLLATYDDLDLALENLIWYHLFGDPSLSLRFSF